MDEFAKIDAAVTIRMPSGIVRLGTVIGDFVTRLSSTLTEFGNLIMQGLSNISAVAHAADSIARRCRWCISTSWPPQLIVDIATMAEEGRPLHEFESRMMSFYRDNSWDELEKLLLATCSYDSIAPHRKRILLDTVMVLRAADRDAFNGASFAIPTLFAELEGILRDFAAADLGIVDGPGKSITVKQMMEPLAAVASRIEKPACEVITRLLFASYRDKVPPIGMRFNRHYYSHGRTKSAARVSRVVRLLLMIDLVAYLIDLKRESQAPAVRLRALWAILLNGFTDIGAMNSAMGWSGELVMLSDGSPTQ